MLTLVNPLIEIFGMETIDEIEHWLERSGMNEARLGLLATANARAIQRIRDGSAQISTLRNVLKYIRANPAKPGPLVRTPHGR
jgi:hypothetical protein